MGPGVITSEHDPLVSGDQLVDDVVLGDLVGTEVAGHVNEGGEAAGGQALQPLHCGGGRVRHEPVQLARGRPSVRGRGCEPRDDRQPVLAVTRGRVEAGRVKAEVMPERVNQQDDSFAEQGRGLAAELGAALRPVG